MHYVCEMLNFPSDVSLRCNFKLLKQIYEFVQKHKTVYFYCAEFITENIQIVHVIIFVSEFILGIIENM